MLLEMVLANHVFVLCSLSSSPDVTSVRTGSAVPSAFEAASQVVLVMKDLPVNVGDIRDAGSIPGAGRPPLEEGTATHSSTLAWRMPWAEEPGGLQSMKSQSWTQLKRLNTKTQDAMESMSEGMGGLEDGLVGASDFPRKGVTPQDMFLKNQGCKRQKHYKTYF